MRPANKKALLIATIMASLSTYLCPACTARAIPAGRIPVHMPAPVKKMEQPSRYQQLLAKYLEYINDPARTRRGINLSSTITVLHDPDLPNPLAAEGEDGLLARLRKMADKHSDGKLDFEDDIAGRLFDPTSSSSARIFATLLKENRVRTESVISSLYCIAYTLCPEWIQVAKDIYAQNRPTKLLL
jgi:hypothetical protein